MQDLLTIDDFKNLRGKTVLVRVDLNSPIERGKIVSNKRFEAHAQTVKTLAARGAKVVVLAHQGRKGDPDFTSLKLHAAILAKLSGCRVAFTPDREVVSPKTLASIKALPAGGVILLDNVRFLPEEPIGKMPAEHARGTLVAALAPLADLYVNDAFSNSHRSHESMVGFPTVMASCAGPVLWRELDGAGKAREHAKHPNIYILGGAKPSEALELMEYALKNQIADKILTAGVIGELCLIARGNELPPATVEELKRDGHDKLLLPVRDLIHEYHEFIETPFDFAFEGDDGKRFEMMLTVSRNAAKPIGDIGVKTYQKYGRIIAKSKTVYLKGPPGMYEREIFQTGTKFVLNAMVNSTAYTLLGGGHSSAAAEKFGIPSSKFSFVSLSGGALEKFMQGKPLPAITALVEAKRNFGATLGARKMPEKEAPLPEITKTRQAKLEAKAHSKQPKPAARTAAPKRPAKTAVAPKHKLKPSRKSSKKPTPAKPRPKPLKKLK